MASGASDRAPASIARAHALHSDGRFVKALEELDRCAPQGGGPPAEPFLRAALLMRLGRVAEAIAAQRAGIAAEPSPRARIALSTMLQAAGDIAGAERAARAALADDPALGAAWWTLANIKTRRLSDEDRSAMQAALAAPAGDAYEHACLHFALARWFAQRGAIAEEWRHLDAANALRAAAQPYRPESITALVDRTIAVFTPEFLAARAECGHPSRAPIFIVGMPRAGSTLVERMLEASGEVAACGELPAVVAIAASLGGSGRLVDPGYLAGLAAVPCEGLAELGGNYLARAAPFHPPAAGRFSDKMPNNWLFAGLIAAMLPNARIVDVRRHPLDCGLSNYRENFARGQAYSYDLAAIGRYYADYVRSIDHFRRVRPDAVHRVVYDRLVSNPEAELRPLCDFLGIAWSPAMTSFHTVGSSVRTASAAQVREPLHARGVGGWRDHADRLAPLAAALGSVLETWDR